MALPDNIVALPGATDDFVLVPPGEYTAVYVAHKAGIVFRTPKLRVDFRLVEHLDVILQRWYRIVDFRGGRIRVIRSSDLARELSAVLGTRVRPDRVPVNSFVGIAMRVEVRTVNTDSRQRKLAGVNQYSVIARVLERVL